MPENRKCFIHGTVVEACFRTEEGLPFPPTPYIKAILESIFARAQMLYQVKICHLVTMPNHIHIIFVILDPEAIPSFMEYVKRESSHAVNHLLGRRKHTVWISGYDSPTILDAAKVLDRITYIYSNPAKDGLEDSIGKYPHFSSWQAFLDGGKEMSCLRIPRDEIPMLPRRTMSFREQEEFAEELKANGREELMLVIEPDAWMQCFDEFRDRDPELIKEIIISLVRKSEEHYRKLRKGTVLGAHALRLQPIDKAYTSKKHQKRMLCLSSFKVLRKEFVSWFRGHTAKAPVAERGFVVSDYLAKLPPGLFAPGGKLRANLLASSVPTANSVRIYE